MELAPPRAAPPTSWLRDPKPCWACTRRPTQRLFGYRYVETPTFEHTELFARTSGETSDVVTKEMYTFEDKGGRSLTLRPDPTAGVVRAYLEHAHDQPDPFKGYNIDTKFRHDRPRRRAPLASSASVGRRAIAAAGRPRRPTWVIALADGYLRDPRAARTTSAPELDRRRGLPSRVPRMADPYLSSPTTRRLDEDCRTRLHQPASGPGLQGGRAQRRSCWPALLSDHLCDPCAAAFAAVRTALDKGGHRRRPRPALVRGLDYFTRGPRSSSSAAPRRTPRPPRSAAGALRRPRGGGRRASDAGCRVRDGPGPGAARHGGEGVAPPRPRSVPVLRRGDG